jgi:hypothetical protein
MNEQQRCVRDNNYTIIDAQCLLYLVKLHIVLWLINCYLLN